MAKLRIYLALLGGLGCFFFVSPVFAYQIQYLPNTPVEGDYILGPGKTEVWANPGERLIKEVTITNRLGYEMTFSVEIEDFKGSRNPEQSLVFMGSQKGPFSLRDYLHPEQFEFTLKHGERMVLPVIVDIPYSAEPGGLYGAVLVRTNPHGNQPGADKTLAKGQMMIISRVGSLFFVRVKGPVEEDGKLQDFSADKLFEKGPIAFKITYENNGNVYLNPYGIVEINNLLGKKVGEVVVDPYYVLPDSVKLKEVKWNRGFLFGRYTARLQLNRGYSDIIDDKTVVFWVLPWKVVTAIVAGLLLVLVAMVWVAKNFEIRKK